MATQHERQRQQPLHILFFPFFAPGHLLPAADVASVFAARGARCTILTTPVNADIIRPAVDRANDANNLHSTASRAIDIALMPFPDVGLPPGVENYMALTTLQVDCRTKFMRAVQLVREPFSRFLADNRPIDVVVSDSFFSWSADAAAEHGVPRLVFTGTSVFARSCNESMLRSNPFETTTANEGDREALVSLPGLPHRVELRRSQMMDPGKQPGAWAFYQSNNAADQRSFGEVFNSFHDLEPDYVEHFQTMLGRRAFLVGPVALATRDMAGSGDNVNTDVNKDCCLRWLDTKPTGSVVYVSFGTATRFSPVELREISRGLDLSGKNFVWAISAGESTEWMPEGFAELTANVGDSRGFIIRGWAPQTLILNHPALGGFITHCGWNSVLEAVTAGVPMVTWPRYADQFYNEKLVVEVLKVGVSVGARDYASPMDTHQVIGGEVIAGSIAALMGNSEQGDAIRKKTRELGVVARRAVGKGGSSYSDVGGLMDELMARRRCSVKVGEYVRAAGGV